MSNNVEIIKANPLVTRRNDNSGSLSRRVAAYCRVSSDSDDQKIAMILKFVTIESIYHSTKIGIWLTFMLMKGFQELKLEKDKIFKD